MDVCLYVYVCVHVCIYVYVYGCVYVFIYMYTKKSSLFYRICSIHVPFMAGFT